MASKRETLKFYRLDTHPSYLTVSVPGNQKVRGYVNYYDEFKQWDVEYTKEYSSIDPQYTYIGPRNFFTDEEQHGPYKDIAFIINDIFVPYNRETYDLEALQNRVYILNFTAGKPTQAVPVIPGNLTKVYEEAVITTPKILTFRINPTSLRLMKRKLFQQIRTRAGWAFQHWGPQIGEIHLEGVTGNIQATPQIQIGTIAGIPVIPQTVDEIPTENNSPALRAFREIERWYDEDQDENFQDKGYLTAIEYRGRIYVGHIADFQYEERGTSPFMLYYRMKFMVHYDAGNLQAATSRARSQIVRNEETQRYINNLRNAPTESET